MPAGTASPVSGRPIVGDLMELVDVAGNRNGANKIINMSIKVMRAAKIGLSLIDEF
jgi:hypothetical protein